MPPRIERSEPCLPLLRYRLTFSTLEPVHLPPLQGTLWRGVLGAQLKTANEKVYSYIFDTPPPSDARIIRRYPHAPHPYIITAPVNPKPVEVLPGQTLDLDITLIGSANAMAQTVIAALARAGRGGVGKTRGRAELVSVETVWHAEEPENRPLPPPGAGKAQWPEPQSPAMPPMPERYVEIRLLSPLRMMVNGKLVTPTLFSACDFLRALMRRISALMAFHTPYDLAADFRALTDLMRQTEAVDAWLAFPDGVRWSARQQAELPTGGLIGAFILDMRALAPLWPYLWLGQWVHVGKGTVMGLGRYRMFDLQQ